MPNVNEMSGLQEVALERLAWSRGFVHRLLEPLSDEQLVARAGGGGNHGFWIMGHLATTDDAILAMVTGAAPVLGEPFEKLFGMNSEPAGDTSAYPTRGELLEAMASSRQRFNQWVESLDESSYRTPMPEQLQPLAPDAVTLPFAIAAHEMIHAGQLTAVRAALGVPRLF